MITSADVKITARRKNLCMGDDLIEKDLESSSQFTMHIQNKKRNGE